MRRLLFDLPAVLRVFLVALLSFYCVRARMVLSLNTYAVATATRVLARPGPRFNAYLPLLLPSHRDAGIAPPIAPPFYRVRARVLLSLRVHGMGVGVEGDRG